MSQINVNNIVGKNGASAVTFPHGINVTGVVTATTLNQNVTGNVTAGSFTGPLTGAVTGTASLASNLTGTPNITVGTVGCGNVTSSGNISATDATFSGNLTVNGTTTTIDTAVTAVDSLAVDGSITALGNCGIGTVSPVASAPNYNGAALHLHQPSSSSAGSQVHLTNGTTGNAAGDGAHISMWSDSDLYITNQESAGDIKFASGGYSDRMAVSQHGMVKFGAPLAEKCHYTGTALQSDYHHDLITNGNVLWSDTAAAGAFTFNLRGSATVALNDMMAIGESLSFWLAHACHSDTTRYMTAFKVDGTTISGGNIIWAGGSAPTAAGGGSGTKDVYTFTVFKVGDANFRAFAAQTNHA